MKRTYTVYVSVSDYAKVPTKYGEYWKSNEKPKDYYGNIKKAKLIIDSNDN